MPPLTRLKQRYTPVSRTKTLQVCCLSGRTHGQSQSAFQAPHKIIIKQATAGLKETKVTQEQPALQENEIQPPATHSPEQFKRAEVAMAVFACISDTCFEYRNAMRFFS
jgi:hypothetical protein